MEPSLWIVCAIALLGWCGSWAMFARFRAVPEHSGDSENSGLKLSIIVPARNEENNLGRLLKSIEAQSFAVHEIIVTDDQSEDGTAECARRHGARVISGKPLPDGWLGKPWACQQGGDAATGDWFLFLDADTEFEPGGLGRLVELAGEERVVHSVCPYHRVSRPYEQLSVFFNVIMVLGMNAFSLKGARARDIGLFGQALLISHPQYQAVGGHSSVKGEVLENFHLSRHLARGGATCRCWLGAGTIRMRMFPGGLRDLIAGWSKGAVSGAGNTAKGALVGVSVWISSLFMTIALLCFLPLASPMLASVIGVLYGLCVLQLCYLFRKVGSYWILGAVVFPVGLIFYQVVFGRALGRRRRGGSIQWKGRHVD